jgi:hypothetical protein
MDREEKPSVTATDILSLQFKERERTIAKYRLHQQDRIKMQEQVSGMHLESQQPFEDEDALDLYYKIEYRLPEESFMEDTLWQIWQNSDYEYLKRAACNDCARFNMIVGKLEELPYTQGSTLANRMRVRWVDPENTVYNIFKAANGSDVTIIGEAYSYTVSEARRKYPNITEDQWFKVAQASRKGLKESRPLVWQDSYIYSYTRPYDDYGFICFDFEVKVFDKEYYVRPKDMENADWMVTPKNGRPQGVKEDVVIEESGRDNWYGGLWVVNTDVMLDWRVLSNQIRPYQNGVDSFSNYVVVYPDADGYYVPSLVERGVPIVKQLIVVALKIQQMVALMEPDNMGIDVSGLRDLDIGTGALLKPIDVLKIKLQTGKAFFDSTDTSGVGGEGNPLPYHQLPYAGNVAQLNVLIGLYNFWQQRLSDEWGENQETLGLPTPGKKSATATRQATIAGGAATEYVYDAFTMWAEQMSTRITYKLWDMLVFEGAEYKALQNDGDEAARSLVSATFDVNVDMIDKRARKERQTIRIQEALNAGIITMSTAERLEDIENPKTAILYLEKLEKRSKKEEMSKMQMQMQLNAQVQQQSTQIASQGKIQEIQAQAMGKVLLEQVKGNEQEYKELVKMISDAETEAAKTGKELPMDIMVLKNILIQEVVGKHNQAGQQQQPQGAPPPQQGATRNSVARKINNHGKRIQCRRLRNQQAGSKDSADHYIPGFKYGVPIRRG